MQHWGSGRDAHRIFSEVKIALLGEHVVNRPRRHPESQLPGLVIVLCEIGQGVDGLSCALAVDWVDLIVVIFGAAAFFKKILLVELQARFKLLLKLPITGVFHVALQAIQVVAGVEIIDPMVLRMLPIQPGPVRQLPAAAEPHRLPGHLQIISTPSVFGRSCQNRSPYHIGIVDIGMHVSWMVPQACARIGLLARKL